MDVPTTAVGLNDVEHGAGVQDVEDIDTRIERQPRELDPLADSEIELMLPIEILAP